jgi:hypothetical protein
VTYLVSPDCWGKAFTARLFLPFDEHNQIDIELSSLSKGGGRTSYSQNGTFVVRNTSSVEVAVPTRQLPRVTLPILLGSGLDVVMPVKEQSLPRASGIPSKKRSQHKWIPARFRRQLPYQLGNHKRMERTYQFCLSSKLGQDLAQKMGTLPTTADEHVTSQKTQ